MSVLARAWLGAGLLATLLALTTLDAGAVWRSNRQVTANAFQTATVSAPSALAAFRFGQRVFLFWTAGTNGDGYQILRATNTAPNCVGVTWTPIAHVAGIHTTFYTDTATKITGRWYCYQVKTTLSTWTSQTNDPTTIIQ